MNQIGNNEQKTVSSSGGSNGVMLYHPVDFSNLPSVHEDDLKTNNNSYYSSRYAAKIDLIIPRIYLSDDNAARNLNLLTQNNITHILNLTTNIPNKYEKNNIKYKKLVILDFESQNISQYFSEANEFIDDALKENEKNNVLVHCNAGISRSSSFVIAYLMHKKMFKTYKQALKHVRKSRPIVSPNKGFEKQLISLECNIKKKNACVVM